MSWVLCNYHSSDFRGVLASYLLYELVNNLTDHLLLLIRVLISDVIYNTSSLIVVLHRKRVSRWNNL